VKPIFSRVEHKVLDYLNTHKKPVTQKQLAKYFIMSTSSIANALGGLEAMGLVIVTKQGNTKLYRINNNALNNAGL
jgi:Mn-dependent DtxR family transcriptional regulator